MAETATTTLKGSSTGAVLVLMGGTEIPLVDHPRVTAPEIRYIVMRPRLTGLQGAANDYWGGNSNRYHCFVGNNIP